MVKSLGESTCLLCWSNRHHHHHPTRLPDAINMWMVLSIACLQAEVVVSHSSAYTVVCVMRGGVFTCGWGCARYVVAQRRRRAEAWRADAHRVAAKLQHQIAESRHVIACNTFVGNSTRDLAVVPAVSMAEHSALRALQQLLGAVDMQFDVGYSKEGEDVDEARLQVRACVRACVRVCLAVGIMGG